MTKIWTRAEVLELAEEVRGVVEHSGRRAALEWLADEYDLTDPRGDNPIIDQTFYRPPHGNQDGLRLWVDADGVTVEAFDPDGEGLGRWQDIS